MASKMRLYLTYLAITAVTIADGVPVEEGANTGIPLAPYERHDLHNESKNPYSYSGHNEYTDLHTSSVLRILAKTLPQKLWLVTLQYDPELDFWTAPQVMEPTDVMVYAERNDSFVKELKAKQLEWTVLIADMKAAVESERARQRGTLRAGADEESYTFDRYLRYVEIIMHLKRLAERFPKTASVQSIGLSSEGRHIPVFTISTGGRQMRPLVLVEGGIHGNEWITTAMALYIIQELVENTEDDDLTSDMDWHIMPLVNPDGYEYTHEKDRFWRGNRGVSLCDDGRRSYGVDINRNFDYHWLQESEAQNNTCKKFFTGSRPFSEPESRALRHILQANRRRAALYLSFHSHGKHILYPWFYDDRKPDNWRNLEDLAQRANEAQWKTTRVNYVVGAGAREYLSTPGTSTDWARGVMGVPLIYTVFLPGGGNASFDPPASTIRDVVTGFFPAVDVLARQVTTPQYVDDYALRLKPSRMMMRILICYVVFSGLTFL